MSPDEILQELVKRSTMARSDVTTVPLMSRLRDEEEAATLIDALRRTDNAHAKAVLCDALGFRRESAAVDDLIACLVHADDGVRSSAADALAKIGDVRAGAPLLARLEVPEQHPPVRRMLLAALGAVKHRPAIPLLIHYLESSDASERGSAAWSLGALKAQEAVNPLLTALTRERSNYPLGRMSEAYESILAARRPDNPHYHVMSRKAGAEQWRRGARGETLDEAKDLEDRFLRFAGRAGLSFETRVAPCAEVCPLLGDAPDG